MKLVPVPLHAGHGLEECSLVDAGQMDERRRREQLLPADPPHCSRVRVVVAPKLLDVADENRHVAAHEHVGAVVFVEVEQVRAVQRIRAELGGLLGRQAFRGVAQHDCGSHVSLLGVAVDHGPDVVDEIGERPLRDRQPLPR